MYLVTAGNARITKGRKRTSRVTASSRGRKKTKSDDVTVCCSGCGEQYMNSTDEWLQCSMARCKLWYELSCTGLQGVSRAAQNKFVCEQCNWLLHFRHTFLNRCRDMWQVFFSERERTWVHVRYMLSPVRLSVCRLWRSCTLLRQLKFSVIFLRHLVPWPSVTFR